MLWQGVGVGGGVGLATCVGYCGCVACVVLRGCGVGWIVVCCVVVLGWRGWCGWIGLYLIGLDWVAGACPVGLGVGCWRLCAWGMHGMR